MRRKNLVCGISCRDTFPSEMMYDHQIFKKCGENVLQNSFLAILGYNTKIKMIDLYHSDEMYTDPSKKLSTRNKFRYIANFEI